MKKISIAIPVYNEEKNVREAYAVVRRLFDSLKDRYDYEIVFTDNHSDDNSYALLQDIASTDWRVKVARFSRNFGYQKSIYTGYSLSTGDAVIQLDCDLQDPVSLIPEFLKKWEEGYAVVYGVRKTRSEGMFITALRKIFYRLIDFLSEDALPHDAGDFRLVDRRVIDELKRVYDYNPYLRGSIASMGFNQIGIPYDRLERVHGESKFNFSSLFRLAMDGILNHSIVPLRIASFIGMFTFGAALLLMVGYLICKAVLSKPWPAGFTTTTTLLLLSMSLNALFLGIIGEYIGRIYQQIKKRPIAIIEKSLNL